MRFYQLDSLFLIEQIAAVIVLLIGVLICLRFCFRKHKWYVGWTVIYENDGKTYSAIVKEYDKSTKVATINSAWNTTPDNYSIFMIVSKVDDVTKYWIDPPPQKSDRCLFWEQEIAKGWKPNRRIKSMGYHERAEFFGVYIWEYLNVIMPLLNTIKE